MAKLTKAARRRAALKGWRKRTRKPRKAAKRKNSARSRISKALKKLGLRNPARVKGHKVKGGRGVSLKNFTGTVVRKSNGQVLIRGKASGPRSNPSTRYKVRRVPGGWQVYYGDRSRTRGTSQAVGFYQSKSDAAAYARSLNGKR